MKKLALPVLALVCCVSFISSIYAATLAKGDVVYARSNLRAQGGRIFWHSMSCSPAAVPVGTEVKVVTDAGGWVVFTVADSNKQYTLVAASRYWDKYFVKNRNDLGLEKLSPDRKYQVENGEVIDGMTKEEIYASKGCPAYSAWGKKTEKSPLAEIMQSDTWYYMTNTRGQDMMVTFQNGIVVKTGGFEK